MITLKPMKAGDASILPLFDNNIFRAGAFYNGENVAVVDLIKPGDMIANFYVKPEYRKYGVGHKLFSYFLNRPELSEQKKLRLVARPFEPKGSTAPLIPIKKLADFYKKFGFQEAGTTINSIVMVKET